MSTTTAPPFIPVIPQISLYTPPTHNPTHLIILCAWLGAHTKHIAKYTSTYVHIAPRARILLIECNILSITSSYAAQRRAILPAVEIVRATLSNTEKPRILLHTFSNGGPNSATQLLIVLKEQIGSPLPLVGTICDSGPAAGEYWKNHNAMVLSLPPGISRILGVPIVHGILILLALSVVLGRYEKLEVLIRRTLLSSEYVVGCGERRICYVYSKADKMTHWEDVEGHARIARGAGWEVEEWCLEGTAHCNHFSADVEGYVGRMRGIWEGEKGVGG